MEVKYSLCFVLDKKNISCLMILGSDIAFKFFMEEGGGEQGALPFHEVLEIQKHYIFSRLVSNGGRC